MDTGEEGNSFIPVQLQIILRVKLSQEDSKPREARDWRKPNWWKRSVRSYWLLIVLINAAEIMAFTLIALSLQIFSIVELVGGVVLTIVLLSIAYYIRVKFSIKIWRALWILFPYRPCGTWATLLIIFAVPIVIGAFIGDWGWQEKRLHATRIVS